VVKYSPKAARALGFLKRTANDVDIYVEDTANPNMWVRLLRKILPQGVRLKSVNMLAGRKNVLDACRLDQLDDGRRKIYIIDGDFDRMHHRRKPVLKFLHRLSYYCVENILISPSAISIVGMESSPTMSEQIVIANIEYAKLLKNLEDFLRPLFIVYASANKLTPSVTTVGHSVYKLIKNLDGVRILDDKLVRSRIKEVVSQAATLVPIKEFRTTRRIITERVKHMSVLTFASGKDYLLPIFHCRLRDKANYRGSIEQLKVRLSGEFDQRIDGRFYRAIRAL
jgi:hypothetical protein